MHNYIHKKHLLLVRICTHTILMWGLFLFTFNIPILSNAQTLPLIKRNIKPSQDNDFVITENFTRKINELYSGFSSYCHSDDEHVKYVGLNLFSDGLAWTWQGQYHGVIDTNGNIVIPFQYNMHDLRHGFRDGIAWVKKDHKWGAVDTKGNIVIPLKYYEDDEFGPYNGNDVVFYDKLVVVVSQDGKRIAFDNKGVAVIPWPYDEDMYELSDGLFEVRKDGKSGVVGTTGNVVIPLIYDGVRRIHDGGAIVVKDDKWGVVDTTGNVVIPLIYEEVLSFHDGVAVVVKDDKWGTVDTTGNVFIPFQENRFRCNICSREGLLETYDKNNKLWGIIDYKGNVVIPLIYDLVLSFHDGVAIVQKDGKWGMVDTAGNIIIPFLFDDITNAFGDDSNILKVRMNGENWFLDGDGNYFLEEQYSNIGKYYGKFEILWYQNGLFSVVFTTNQYKNFPIYGYMDRHGHCTITEELLNNTIGRIIK